MVALYVSTSSMDLCKESVTQLGTRFTKWWWDQKGLNLVVLWEAAEDVTSGEKERVYGGSEGVAMN